MEGHRSGRRGLAVAHVGVGHNPDYPIGDGTNIWVPNQRQPLEGSGLNAFGSFPTGPGTFAVGDCGDGINFWIALDTGHLARF